MCGTSLVSLRFGTEPNDRDDEPPSPGYGRVWISEGRLDLLNVNVQPCCKQQGSFWSYVWLTNVSSMCLLLKSECGLAACFGIFQACIEYMIHQMWQNVLPSCLLLAVFGMHWLLFQSAAQVRWNPLARLALWHRCGAPEVSKKQSVGQALV